MDGSGHLLSAVRTSGATGHPVSTARRLFRRDGHSVGVLVEDRAQLVDEVQGGSALALPDMRPKIRPVAPASIEARAFPSMASSPAVLADRLQHELGWLAVVPHQGEIVRLD